MKSSYSCKANFKYSGESGLLRYFANQWFNNVLGEGPKKYSWKYVPKNSRLRIGEVGALRNEVEITAERTETWEQ